jgi:phage shock protein E
VGKKTFALLGVALVLAAAVFLLVRRRGDLTPDEAHRLVERGALLVDVRSPDEFAAGHLPNAVNVPVGELDARLGELGPKDRPLVLYCRSGNRSARAAGTLTRAGFTGVHNLGAMSRW